MLKKLSTIVATLALIHTSSTFAAEDAAKSVSVSDPYVRAVPAGQPNSAAFMTLHNSSLSHHAVVSAESPVAGIVELHTHIDDGGVMKMRQVNKIVVNPGSDTVLTPGSLHVMLMKLKKELKPGSNVSVTLVFDDGSRKEIQAPVKAMQTMMHDHSKMQH